MSWVLIRNPSLPCACQSVTTSSGLLSLAMAFSLGHRFEAAGENLLDAMDPGGHIARRDAGDLGDSRGVGSFEIEEDDLPLERIQLLNEFAEAAERLLKAERSLGITTGRQIVDVVEAHQRPRTGAPVPDDVRGSYVVRHAIDPRAQRAVTGEPFEA